VTARDRIVLTVVIAAALVGGFWFLVLAPQRHKASSLGSQLAKEQKRLDSAQAEAAQSRAARIQYPRNYATVAQLGKAVPESDDVPSLVYQLSSASQSVGVDFRSIKLQNSASGGTSSAPSSTPAPAPGKGSSTSTPAAATQAATATLPPGAVVGAAGFPTMPFSFTFEGSFFRLSSFFSRLESLIRSTRRGLSVRGRLLTIDGLALTAGTKGFPQMKAAVAATAYLLPADQGLTNGATPATPPSSAAKPVSTGAGSTSTTPPAATAGAVR
jgi:Type II secretion system (T2SS), protein M